MSNSLDIPTYPCRSKPESTKLEPLYSQQDWTRLHDISNAIYTARNTQREWLTKIEQTVTDNNNFRSYASKIQNRQIQLRILREKIQQARKRLRATQLRLAAFIDEGCELEKAREQLRSDMMLDSTKIQRLLTENEQLNMELECIFKQKCHCVVFDMIRGLHLPQPKAMLGHSDVEMSAAFGTLIVLLDRLSRVFDLPLKHLCYFMGSKSIVQCRNTDKIFPLYNPNMRKHRNRFDNAALLLNEVVNQICADAGILMLDRDRCVKHLHEFLEICLGKLKARLVRPTKNVYSSLSTIVHIPKVSGADDPDEYESTVSPQQQTTIEFVEKMTKSLLLTDNLDVHSTVLNVISPK